MCQVGLANNAAQKKVHTYVDFEKLSWACGQVHRCNMGLRENALWTKRGAFKDNALDGVAAWATAKAKHNKNSTGQIATWPYRSRATGSRPFNAEWSWDGRVVNQSILLLLLSIEGAPTSRVRRELFFAPQ